MNIKYCLINAGDWSHHTGETLAEKVYGVYGLAYK